MFKKYFSNENSRLQESNLPLKDNTIENDFSFLKSNNRKKSFSSSSSDNQSEKHIIKLHPTKYSKSNNNLNISSIKNKLNIHYNNNTNEKKNFNKIFSLKTLIEKNPNFLKKHKTNSLKTKKENNIKSDEAFRVLSKKDKIDDSESSESETNIDNNNDICNNYILLPDNPLRQFWDVIVGIFLIYTSIVFPYRISFLNENSKSGKKLKLLDDIIDNFFILDIIINFLTAYYTNDERIEKRINKIIFHYLKSWFILDFISIIPINYIINKYISEDNYNMSSLIKIAKLPKIYHIIRLFRLIKVFKFAKKNNITKFTRNLLDKFHINIQIERLIYYILGLFMFIHLSACFFFFIAKLEDFSPESWVNKLGLIDASPFELYITSFYWSLTTVTTVGYGDVVSNTFPEKIYNLFIMSFGVVMYSFLIGMLSKIVEIIDQKNLEMNNKLNELSELKKYYDIDDEIYEKTKKIIKYDLTRSQEQKKNFLLELPNKLRDELNKIINDNVIKKIIFFQDKPQLINFILPLLKQMRYGKNENIYKIGEIPDESKIYFINFFLVYFIIKGTVIFYLGEEYNFQQIYEVKKHRNFGEIEMCLNEKLSHNIKVKSRQCELFLLKKNDFLKMSVNFPEQIEKFLNISLLKYLRFNDEKKKIIMQKEKEIESMNSSYESTKNNLSHISEEISKYNSFNSSFSSEDSNSKKKLNLSKSSKNLSSFSSKISSLNSSVNKEDNNNDIKINDLKIHSSNNLIGIKFDSEFENNNRKILKNKTTLKKSIGSPQEKILFENNDKNQKEMKYKIKLNTTSINQINKKLMPQTRNSFNEVRETVNQVQKNLNETFSHDIDKMVNVFEKNKNKFGSTILNNRDPVLILKKLKNCIDDKERNDLIIQLESLLK